MRSIFLAVILSSTLTSVYARKQVIYGEDGRKEVFEANRVLQEIARSTPSMIPVKNIFFDEKSQTYFLKQQTLNQTFIASLNEKNVLDLEDITDALTTDASHQVGFCPTERFINQPSPSVCSSFLIAPDLVVTAGHCALQKGACENFKWVFDFKVDPLAGNAGFGIPEGHIFSCKKIISASLNNLAGIDYGLIQLDRKVVGRKPLKLRTEGKINLGEKLVVIGNPSGLPLKVTEGGEVRAKGNPFYFEASLDTYQGNSGSVVINAQTLEVEGILVRGDTDFVFDQKNSCVESHHCSDHGCRGEGVSRIHSIPEVSFYSSLMKAAEFDMVDILDQISGYINDIDFNLADGETALLRAARHYSLNAIRFLIAKGAKVSAKDENGDTVLHHLARSLKIEDSEILKELIRRGADLKSLNNKMQTPLMVAIESGNLMGQKLLRGNDLVKKL